MGEEVWVYGSGGGGRDLPASFLERLDGECEPTVRVGKGVGGREGDWGDEGNLKEEVGDGVLGGAVLGKVGVVLDGEEKQVSFLVAVVGGDDVFFLGAQDCFCGFLVWEGDGEIAPVGKVREGENLGGG